MLYIVIDAVASGIAEKRPYAYIVGAYDNIDEAFIKYGYI